MVHSLFIGLVMLMVLGGLWYLLQPPRCQSCQAALRQIDELVRPWGRYGVEMIFFYQCPSCAWTTKR